MPRNMKDDWWFKMEHLKWLTDEQLNRCSLETQGFWIRTICIMHKSASAKLSGTEAELVRLLNVTRSAFHRCVNELTLTKAATVTQTAHLFTLVSRKYAKELKVREQGRLRKQRERRHAQVADKSQDRVISKSKELEKEVRKEEEKREEPPPVASDFGEPQNRPKKDSLHNDPVIEALRTVTKRNPPPESRQHLINKVGGVIDLPKLFIAFGEWSACGYKVTNFNGILDWYLGNKNGKVTSQKPFDPGRRSENEDTKYVPEFCKYCGKEFCLLSHEDEWREEIRQRNEAA